MAEEERPERVEELKLADSLTHLLEECRMVLPGIQALFGFQLIAVFNQSFSDKLDPWQQQVHLLALLLVGVAIALVMAPASLHRQVEQGLASDRLIRTASRLMVAAMVLLAVAIALEIFLVSSVIVHGRLGAGVISLALLLIFVALWFVLPPLYRARRRRAEGGTSP